MPVVNNFAVIAARLQQKADLLVRKTAFVVVGGAMVRSRVDSGAMRAAWYVVTNRGDTYDEAVAAAKEANPDVKLLPKADEAGPFTSVVANAVEYAEHHETGTTVMTAQPMIHPAIDAAKPAFDAEFDRLLDP